LFHERTRPAEAFKARTRYERRGTVYTMNVKVPAMSPSATPACAARADTVLSMSAPLAVFPDRAGWLVEADVSELEVVLTLDDTAARGALVGVALVTTTAGVTGEVEPEVEALEVLFELVLPPGRYDGGGTTLDGSVRAPVPQGIA